jgi:hypothetical protein
VFTLNLPIQLPEEHGYFDNGQYPVPPLPGGLAVSCIALNAGVIVLRVSGFATEQAATNFCPSLVNSLRIAALDSKHSLTPSDACVVTSNAEHFNGSTPTVTPTAKNAMPYHATMRQTEELHISVMTKLVAASLSKGSPDLIAANPELALSVELFSDFEFAGGTNAQFIMLFAALEALVPITSKKGKRGAVLGIVKAALAKVAHPDPKSVVKSLDKLYEARNDLVHSAKSVTDKQLGDLREIVRTSLKAMLA